MGAKMWKLVIGFLIVLSVAVFGGIVFLVYGYTRVNSNNEDDGAYVEMDVLHQDEVMQVVDKVENDEGEENQIELSEELEEVNDEVILQVYGGVFDLPLYGATGFAPVFMPVRGSPDLNSTAVIDLSPGTGFTILEEQGEWWQIEVDGLKGWVLHGYCFINLPDVMPSIVYNITNARSSVIRSSGVEVPSVTGYSLYESFTYNPRLGREEFIVPILYSTGKKVANAQEIALGEGNTLVIVEAFRPLSTQMLIVDRLGTLAGENQVVHQGLNQGPWSMGWFIATGVSTHQTGAAIDVSLAQVNETIEIAIGNYSTIKIMDYTEYTMPSPIHELSVQAVVLAYPMSTTDPHGWSNATLAATMNEAAITLQRYLIEAGFTPLASEWWHFDDHQSSHRIRYNSSQGDFVLNQIFSQVPE